ncbi:TetR family transcriptional regulator C-terminal domain-containing protein [Neobacillus vireti]|uniref:TetR family transcriptional regulator C-terminal domain-containing protein n=1 Tax=Neobacillus vireti TaxID=220686 RepID=UPI003B58A823
MNSAVELAVRDIDVDTKTTEGFTKAEQMLKEIILWGQQNGEFTPDYDTEELAEYLHNVLVGLRGMARTSTAKEKLHRIAKLSMNF